MASSTHPPDAVTLTPTSDPCRAHPRRQHLGPPGRWSAALVPALAALALLLAACSPSTSTKASTTPAASPSVTPVQLLKGWTNVPSPSVGAEGRLTAVTALSATDAWSVGQYAGADSVQRTLIEHWDGSQWKFVPSPNPGTQYNILQSVAGTSATDVWAVGYQSSASNATQALIEHWNGSSWNAVPAPDLGKDSGQLNGVAAVTASDAWAVGTSTTNGGANTPSIQHALVEHWDGKTWSNATTLAPAPAGANYSQLNAVAALSSSDVWVAGTSYGQSPHQPFIEHWNGRSWTVVPGAASSSDFNVFSVFSALAAISANDIWGVGTGPQASGLGCGYLQGVAMQHWNGTRWSAVPFPNPAPDKYAQSFAFASVAAASSHDVWAVGSYFAYATEQSAGFTPVIEHWDGARWSIVASPSQPTAQGLTGVAATASGSVWAVGQLASVGGPGASLIEQSSGGAWSTVVSPSPGTVSNELHGVSALGKNDVWAVGSSSNGTLAEHWNGAGWSVVPTPNAPTYDDTLNAVSAASANDVWAVGSSSSGDAKPAMLIEHWDGSAWTVVPAAASTHQYGDTLYATAALSATNVWAVGTSSTIQHWDGAKWSLVPHPASPVTSAGYPLPVPLDDLTLFGIAALSPTNIWAVGGGGFHHCAGQLPVLIEHWDGKSWTAIPNTPGGVLLAVSADAANDVWAVGDGNVVMHYDGKQWATVNLSSPPGQFSRLNGVAAYSPTDVWAVGQTFSVDGTWPLVLHWDGKTWNTLTVPAPGAAINRLNAVSLVSAGELWTVGAYAQSGLPFEPKQALILHYAA